jgi:23S rRNA (guanine2445-N2)-methyltransferase / 23S rRNA (guanine2069-N7)-methyltransferase
MPKEFFITCPKGLEPLLFDEIVSLGIKKCKQTTAGVAVLGDIADAYRICLWSRLANRVLLNLSTFGVSNADDLYNGIYHIDWLPHFSSIGSFVVDFLGTSETLVNSVFSTQKVKDAIVDQMRKKTKNRPNINKDDPDVRINVRLYQGQVTVSIDLSGNSLHQRGYRLVGGRAPLKENLAAALLIRSGWPALAKSNAALVDPMCGSGTLLIEGLLMAANIAPGLLRKSFGFQRWRMHDEKAWQKLIAEAEEKRTEGLSKSLPIFMGYDRDTHLTEVAQENLELTGLEKWIRFKTCELTDLKNETQCETGLIICNPPYGERLESETETLEHLYQQLAKKFRDEFTGWQAAIFTGNEPLCARIGIRPGRKYQFFNGTLACKLFLYTLKQENYFQ